METKARSDLIQLTSRRSGKPQYKDHARRRKVLTKTGGDLCKWTTPPSAESSWTHKGPRRMAGTSRPFCLECTQIKRTTCERNLWVRNIAPGSARQQLPKPLRCIGSLLRTNLIRLLGCAPFPAKLQVVKQTAREINTTCDSACARRDSISSAACRTKNTTTN